MDERRLKYLEKKYSETNVAKDEILPISKKVINKKYYNNQKRRRVDMILNEVKNRNTIKEEVHQIVKTIGDFNNICRNCTDEIIIATIILYVQKTRNTRFYPERTRLWRKYDLNWKTYSLILSRILEYTRKQTPVPE